MINKNVLMAVPLHPLLLTTFVGMLGIWMQSLESSSTTYSIGCILIFLSIFLIKKSTWNLFVIFMPIAYISGALLYQKQLNKHNYFYHCISEHPYDIKGTVTDIQHLDHQRYKCCLLLNITNLKDTISHETIDPQKMISVYSNAFNEIQIGDTIALLNVKFKKPKSVSFKHYLIKQGIISTIFLPPTNIPVVINRPRHSFMRWLYSKKMRIFNAIKTKMSSQTFSFFSSLFLGTKQKTYHQERLKEQFKQWGLSHYLARSGLHLIIFILLWKILLRVIPLSFGTKQALLLLLSVIYYLLSWSSISFARAFFTFIAYCLLILTNQQVNGLHVLTMVTFFILVFNPMQLFFLDFQLSFGLTFALLWFNQLQISNKTSK